MQTNSSLRKVFLLSAGLLIASGFSSATAAASDFGIFGGEHADGQWDKPGLVKFDLERKAYSNTGGGENMWCTNDAFHFVWKKASGDVSLAADIEWPQAGGNAHKKACLLIRQN